MIIDLILDRKFGVPYDAHEFYTHVLQYEGTFNFTSCHISRAMDEGTNKDVQEELCKYILANEYNPQICDYVRSQEWL